MTGQGRILPANPTVIVDNRLNRYMESGEAFFDDAQVYLLWDRIASAGGVHVDESVGFVLESISRSIAADQAGWVGIVRMPIHERSKDDLLLGWRFRAIVYHQPPSSLETSEARQAVRRGLKDSRTPADIVQVLRQAGVFRVHRLKGGLLDFAQFSQTEGYDTFYRAMGVQDRMWVCVPIAEDAEVLFVFDRRSSEVPFSDVDGARAAKVIGGLPWFVRQLAYSHGITLCDEPLTATERAVAKLLLTDKTEREIAQELSQSRHTTHDHAKEIYRKFRVNGRTAFMAVWFAKR